MMSAGSSLSRIFGRGDSPPLDLEAGPGPAFELTEIDTEGLSAADAWEAQEMRWGDPLVPPPAPEPAVQDGADTGLPPVPPVPVPPVPVPPVPEPPVGRNGAGDDLDQILADSRLLRADLEAEPERAALAQQRERHDAILAHARRFHPNLDAATSQTERKPVNVDLALAPAQLTPERVARMEAMDLKMFPDAKNVQMYVIKDKDKDKDKDATPVAPVYAIPLRRNDKTIFVEIEPDLLSMNKGSIRGEGDDITEPVEYDFISNQWTTPAQRQASYVIMHTKVTARLKETLKNDEISRAEASDSVHAQVKQIEQTIETCIAQFYRGEISYKDLSDQLDKKCEEIAKLASDKKSRVSARQRQYLTWGVGILATIAGLSVTGTMVAARLRSGG